PVDLPAGPHGGDAVALARALDVAPDSILDLSASLNPLAPALDPVVVAAAADLGRYPDDHAATELLAAAIDVDPGQLVLTNGGAEAIALVARLEPIGEVIDPEFSLYARHLTEVRAGAPRWRSNPSNPLGVLAEPADRARVWDEAFWPLASGTWTRGDADAWRLGSLTKLWACPGLRIGYAIAPDRAAAERLRARRPRWSVNGVALRAIVELLPQTDLAGWRSGIAELRRRMTLALAARGLDVTETAANWVLVDRPGLRAELLAHGILVRDCGSFGLAGVHRIAVCDDRSLDRLLVALDLLGGPGR
ncbi:MAG: aminotransferase class I/II-fold pyridoxal phosphate-dependent enzyme, partial [Actinomycetota bacterium]